MTGPELADIQSTASHHAIRIDAVGISHVRHPIVVLDRTHAKQDTVANITMSVDLDATARGAHLSRFLEVLDEVAGELTIRTAPRLLSELRLRHGSSTATVDAEFPYFIEKRAPVTGARGLLDVGCRFSFAGSPAVTECVVAVSVPVTTLCPCSKAVSDYGAHNQRCEVTITVRLDAVADPTDDQIIWIEELVDLAERNASAPIYPALKRADERFVTMQAFENPAFVEDVVRRVAVDLSGDGRVGAYCVEAASDESIHNHSAFARIGTLLR